MMLTMILLLTLMAFTFFFPQLTHPLSMGLTFMINTTVTSLMIVTLSQSLWFSYMLSPVFLGSMLVLFIYETSLASNEMFHLNTKMMIFFPIIVIMITMI